VDDDGARGARDARARRPCARGNAERRRLAEAAIEHDDAGEGSEERKKTESPKEWLLEQLGGPSREIDSFAVARALEERAALLSGAKRSGLPVPSIPGWTNLTGFTQSEGRVNHILFPSASSTGILAGADGGGIWRSTDTGASWTPNNDFFGSLSIANLAKASNDNLTMYAATNPRGSHTYFPFGIAKSTDGGVNWAQIASTSPGTNADFEYVTRVAVHPTNSSMVLAATGGGAYLSTTGGTAWTKVGGISTAAYFVAFHPTDGNRMAIGYDNGTVRYTTTGDILGAGAATSTVLAGARYTKIAYAKSDATRMYALVSDNSTGNTRLFMSVTSGASWGEITSLPAVGPGMYNSSYLRYTGGLWVDPLNANRLGLFEGWAFFTPDVTQSTPTWKSLASGWTDMHAMVEDPAYDGVTNKTVYVMDDGGLYRTTDIDNLDQFASFTRLDTGMTVTEIYSVAGHGGNPVIGAQDVGPRVWRTDPSIGDSTKRWRFMQGNGCPGCSWIGDGMTAAASTSNPNVLYGSRQYLDMIRSTDGGATGVSIVKSSTLIDGQGATVANTNASFLAPFVLDPSNPSRMYAGGLSIWRSDNVDSGNPPTWTAIRSPYLDPSCGVNMPAGRHRRSAVEPGHRLGGLQLLRPRVQEHERDAGQPHVHRGNDDARDDDRLVQIVDHHRPLRPERRLGRPRRLPEQHALQDDGRRRHSRRMDAGRRASGCAHLLARAASGEPVVAVCRHRRGPLREHRRRRDVVRFQRRPRERGRAQPRVEHDRPGLRAPRGNLRARRVEGPDRRRAHRPRRRRQVGPRLPQHEAPARSSGCS
jgi:hypothetical protein